MVGATAGGADRPDGSNDAAHEAEPSAAPPARRRSSTRSPVCGTASRRPVERHAPAYAAIVRGGLGGADGEVLAIADRVRDELTRRLVAALSGPRPSKALRLAVRGWRGYGEAVALEWVEHRPVSRARAVALMMAALEATLGAVGERSPTSAD